MVMVQVDHIIYYDDSVYVKKFANKVLMCLCLKVDYY